MDDKFNRLKLLGAGDFKHLNGTLEAHLKKTAAILTKWGADEVLVIAGLFHAAYGTAGFDESMISVAQRGHIRELIGFEAEALVYLYCSCDRRFVFPQFSQAGTILFRDRFSNTEFNLSQKQMCEFCELTVANELELIDDSSAFKNEHGAGLLNLFEGMKPYLSEQATVAYQSCLRQ